MATTRAIGDRAESAALDYLTRRGLKLVQRNFACKAGEIDLIMRDGDTLCFIEVRYRASKRHASGADSVTSSKIRKLIRTAEVYLHTHPARAQCFRFDVVSITDEADEFGIDWIIEAFTAEGY